MNSEISGWLNINKPIRYSSALVVSILKRKLKVKKVGHGGTLDPMAIGVLPICINRATKTVEKLMNFDKEYLFNITFGEERDTGDSEGKVLGTLNIIPTENDIKNVLHKFIGTIKQTPPIYSAIKINGKRSYELARENKAFQLKERDVKVVDLQFIKFLSSKEAQFKVKCGKGFYVRSIGIDLAKELNTVGYISFLERLSVGVFNIENSITIDELLNCISKGSHLEDYLIQI